MHLVEPLKAMGAFWEDFSYLLYILCGMRVLGDLSLARIDFGGSLVERDIGKSEEIPTSLDRHVGGVPTCLDSVASWRGSKTLLGLVWRYTNLHSRGIFHQILGGGDHNLPFFLYACCWRL